MATSRSVRFMPGQHAHCAALAKVKKLWSAAAGRGASEPPSSRRTPHFSPDATLSVRYAILSA